MGSGGHILAWSRSNKEASHAQRFQSALRGRDPSRIRGLQSPEARMPRNPSPLTQWPELCHEGPTPAPQYEGDGWKMRQSHRLMVSTSARVSGNWDGPRSLDVLQAESICNILGLLSIHSALSCPRSNDCAKRRWKTCRAIRAGPTCGADFPPTRRPALRAVCPERGIQACGR